MLKFVKEISPLGTHGTPQTSGCMNEDGEHGLSLSAGIGAGHDHLGLIGDGIAEVEATATVPPNAFFKYSHENGIDGPGIRSWKGGSPDQPTRPDGEEG